MLAIIFSLIGNGLSLKANNIETEIIQKAAQKNLKAIAITDHDNVLSYNIAQNYIKENNLKLEVVNGVEINTIYNNYEIHILGYFMNNNDSDFQKMLKLLLHSFQVHHIYFYLYTLFVKFLCYNEYHDILHKGHKHLEGNASLSL